MAAYRHGIAGLLALALACSPPRAPAVAAAADESVATSAAAAAEAPAQPPPATPAPQEAVSRSKDGLRALVVVGFFLWMAPWDPAPVGFSSEAWKSTRKFKRHAMADDYLRTHDVTSMTLAEVVADLGPPDQIDNWWVYSLTNDDVVRTGQPHKGYRFDVPELVARFSVDQRVETIAVEGRLTLPSGQAFQADGWRALAPTKRSAMLRDLLASGICIGLTKAELVALLGRPEFQVVYPRISYQVALTLADTLVLEFMVGDDGRILSAKVRQT